MLIRRLRSSLSESYWVVPACCVLAAAGLALGLVQADEGLDRGAEGWWFTGGPESARSVLSTIAVSMLTLTSVVFSITIVVLQLASTQFSPRALPTFLRDRSNQLALGVFLATFVYALVALREVRNGTDATAPFVPGITISVAFLLVGLSVGLFVQYIHHIAQSIRVVTIVHRIAGGGLQAIERVHPTEPTPVDPVLHITDTVRVVDAASQGVVTSIDVARLVRAAREADGMVRVLPRVGDFVAPGMPLAEVAAGDLADEVLRGAVQLASERDSAEDVGFAFRQLVDIAERALSPGTNDPSTAVQCIDEIHVLLRRLVGRPYPPAVHHDGEGRPRVIVSRQSWDDHVGLALDELRLWGSDSLQVRRRIHALVVDLLSIADDRRRRPLLERVPLWETPLPSP